MPREVFTTAERSKIAINRLHNDERIMSSMESVSRHHILWSKSQYRHLGGIALEARTSRALIMPMADSAHRELHANIAPPDLSPLEHARRAFIGVENIDLDHINTFRAIDDLAIHFGRVSLSPRQSVHTQRVAQRLEQNLIEQRTYLIDGVI